MWAEAPRARADGPAGVPAPLAAPRAHPRWADAAARRDENVLGRHAPACRPRSGATCGSRGPGAPRSARPPAGETYARSPRGTRPRRRARAAAGTRDGDGERDDDDDGAALLARLADAPSTIEKDVPRTCAAMTYFREGDGARRACGCRRARGSCAPSAAGCARARARTRPARRITAAPATPLHPYSRARPSTRDRYVQGLNAVAAFLLLVFIELRGAAGRRRDGRGGDDAAAAAAAGSAAAEFDDAGDGGGDDDDDDLGGAGLRDGRGRGGGRVLDGVLARD